MKTNETRQLVARLRTRGFTEKQMPSNTEKYHVLVHKNYPGFFRLDGQVGRNKLWYLPTPKVHPEATLGLLPAGPGALRAGRCNRRG